PRRQAIARVAATLLTDRRFDVQTAASLLEAPPSQWRAIWDRRRPQNALDDDPVPFAFERALKHVDLGPLREAVSTVPVRHSANFGARVAAARRTLSDALNRAWTAGLGALDVRLPLLVLDEAHHLKNPTQ